MAYCCKPWIKIVQSLNLQCMTYTLLKYAYTFSVLHIHVYKWIFLFLNIIATLWGHFYPLITLKNNFKRLDSYNYFYWKKKWFLLLVPTLKTLVVLPFCSLSMYYQPTPAIPCIHLKEKKNIKKNTSRNYCTSF